MPRPVAGIEHVTDAGGDVKTGGGIALFGRLAVVPGYSQPTHIVDISVPAEPSVLSTIEELHRNADLIAYPSGRLVAVFSTDMARVLPIWDITDPTQPERLGELRPSTGTHKVNIVPGTPIVYNANSNGGFPRGNMPATAKGVTEIFDLSDPEKPVHVKDWTNGYGCHHIYFYIDAATDYYRAICAGIEVTQIWDIKDPRDPKVVVTIPVHEGNPALPSSSIPFARFSHFSILSADHSVLIVGDETGGGLLPPGCDVHAEAAGRSVSGPLGNLYFYDVKDEKNPKLMGWFSPTSHFVQSQGTLRALNCTAHHGRLVPDPEGKRDLLAMAFYGAGVVLIDFSDPSNPLQVDQWNDATNTWEVWFYHGYLFTGDLARGLGVFKFR